MEADAELADLFAAEFSREEAAVVGEEGNEEFQSHGHQVSCNKCSALQERCLGCTQTGGMVPNARSTDSGTFHFRSWKCRDAQQSTIVM